MIVVGEEETRERLEWTALVEAIKTSPAARDDEIADLEAREREGAADGAEPR